MKKPIIIVGAGRSGTKMLRSILVSAPNTIIFPREINYIWRHGNADFPTDEFTVEQARPEIKDYIRRQFEKRRGPHSETCVIGKTCANALRVDFVHAVLPEAYIIHLIRDGRAVAESARRRWQARPEVRYLLEKARWVPLSDMPYYGWRYLRYQLGRWQNDSQGSQSSWGPRFAGLDTLVTEKALIEVCGIQWRTCVQAVTKSFQHIPSEQILTVRYEDLVNDPVASSQNIFAKTGLTFSTESRQFVEQNIHKGNLNKWQQTLSDRDMKLLLPHIETTLHQNGYEIEKVG